MKKSILLILIGFIILVNTYTAQADGSIQNGNFENGLTSWTVTPSGTSPGLTCSVVTDKSYSPTHSAKLCASLSIGGGTSTAGFVILSQDITLPASATTIDISWCQWLGANNFIGGQSGFSVCLTEQSCLPGLWGICTIPACSICRRIYNYYIPPGTNTGWQQMSLSDIDVSAYAGQTIKLSFMASSAVIPNQTTTTWAYIDDVSAGPPAPAYIDSGLRIRNASGQTVSIAAWPLGQQDNSPLRIFKNNNVYGIVLIDPLDPEYGDLNFDSGVRIQTTSGTKALRKYP